MRNGGGNRRERLCARLCVIMDHTLSSLTASVNFRITMLSKFFFSQYFPNPPIRLMKRKYSLQLCLTEITQLGTFGKKSYALGVGYR